MNIKELEKLFKLCRKQGITEINLDGVSDCGTKQEKVSFKLGDLPQAMSQMPDITDTDPKDPFANFPQGDLTPEQLAFYSSGGSPDDDPYRKDQ